MSPAELGYYHLFL